MVRSGSACAETRRAGRRHASRLISLDNHQQHLFLSGLYTRPGYSPTMGRNGFMGAFQGIDAFGKVCHLLVWSGKLRQERR